MSLWEVKDSHHALGGSRIDRRNGYRRLEGVGATWIDNSNLLVTDDHTLERLRRLAIPPAWVHVWASRNPEDSVQATGVDSHGRTQYRYSPSAVALSSDEKFSHMLSFAEALPSLRTRVAADLRGGRTAEDHLPATLVVASIVRLLERGLFRVGNERYARDNHTYGLTTIRREHLTVRGSEVIFDFIGKEHIRHRMTVEDKDVARVVSDLLATPGGPESELFIAGPPSSAHAIHSTEVNAYLHNHTRSPATAKVFRTWGATAAAAAFIAGQATTVRPARSSEANAIKAVADLLGNTPTVARSSYVHPAAFQAGRSDIVIEAVQIAATRARSSDVRVLFVDPRVQTAVLNALRMDGPS